MEHKLHESTNSTNRYKIQASCFLFLASCFLLLPSIVNGEKGKDVQVPIEMVFVKGGCYQMGDTFGGAENHVEAAHKGGKDWHQHHNHLAANEKPVHEVCVDNFYIGKYEVTIGEFREFITATGYKTDAEAGDGCYGWSGNKWEKDKSRNWRNPGFLQDDSHPVSCVSWDDAVVYAEWLSDKRNYYYLTLALVVGGVLLLRRVLFSPFGYALRAGRDSVLRADAIGIDVKRMQWTAFVIAGLFAGLGGALFAFSKGSISPETLHVGRSVDGLVMVLLGGIQTLAGPVVGAVTFTWLHDTVARNTDYWRAMLGAIILILVLLFPQGIAGGIKQFFDNKREAKNMKEGTA